MPDAIAGMPEGSSSAGLAPPSEGIYPTFDDLLAHVQRFGKEQGYGIVKLRASNYREGKPTRYDLVCDRGGVKYQSTAKKRHPSTRKINCPWRAKAVCEVQLGYQWRFAVQDAVHNHEARWPVQRPNGASAPSQRSAPRQSQQHLAQHQPPRPTQQHQAQHQAQQHHHPQQQHQQHHHQQPLPHQPPPHPGQLQPVPPPHLVQQRQLQQQQQQQQQPQPQPQQPPPPPPQPAVSGSVKSARQNTAQTAKDTLALVKDVSAKLDRMAHDMTTSFMRLEQAVANLGKRLEALESRQRDHDAHFESVDSRLANHDSRLHNHDVRLNNVEARGIDMAMDDVETSRLLANAVM